MKNILAYLAAICVSACVFFGGSFVGAYVSNPCNSVHNSVSYPTGTVRDAADLTWDIKHLHRTDMARWEGRVLYCTLNK